MPLDHSVRTEEQHSLINDVDPFLAIDIHPKLAGKRF